MSNSKAIQLLQVTVKNFFSVGDEPIVVDFNSGVSLIYGMNKDAVSHKDVSNGAGKTTIVNAVYQCLYNKNLKDIKGKITTVSNKYTGKGYHIELVVNVGTTTYTIINSRETNTFAVYADGVIISPKGVNATLKFIEDLIGFDFSSFSGLTFLNQDSLSNIIDLTNENNIVNRFFELDRVLDIQKRTRARRKEIAGDVKELRLKATSIEANINKLNVLATKSARPLSDLLSIKEGLLDAKERLANGAEAKLLKSLSEDISALSVEVSALQKNITKAVTNKNSLLKTTDKLKEGNICPLCKSVLSDDTHSHTVESVKAQIVTIDSQLVTYRRDLSDKESKLSNARDNYNKLHKEYKQKEKKLTEELTNINLEINTSKTLAEASTTIGDKATLEKELGDITKVLDELTKEDDVLLTLDKLIKNGEVMEVYLQQYTRLLMANLAKSSMYLSIPLHIIPSINKGNITFAIQDRDETKSFTQLSSGERTRVSLLILMATLKSLSQLSGVDINLLTLDELLGVLDEDGISLVKRLIDEERNNKSIFIINHHDEIETRFADRVITLCKENNITTICDS